MPTTAAGHAGSGGSAPAGSTVVSSMLNLLNNIVGAGLFSMPWCLKEATVLSGSLVFCFMCAMNVRSFMLLAESCEAIGRYSYLELGRAAFGPRFGRFAQLVTVCYTAGSLVSCVTRRRACARVRVCRPHGATRLGPPWLAHRGRFVSHAQTFRI